MPLQGTFETDLTRDWSQDAEHPWRVDSLGPDTRIWLGLISGYPVWYVKGSSTFYSDGHGWYCPYRNNNWRAYCPTIRPLDTFAWAQSNTDRHWSSVALKRLADYYEQPVRTDLGQRYKSFNTSELWHFVSSHGGWDFYWCSVNRDRAGIDHPYRKYYAWPGHMDLAVDVHFPGNNAFWGLSEQDAQERFVYDTLGDADLAKAVVAFYNELVRPSEAVLEYLKEKVKMQDEKEKEQEPKGEMETVKKSGEVLIKLRVRRLDAGVRVFVQSKALENFFKGSNAGLKLSTPNPFTFVKPEGVQPGMYKLNPLLKVEGAKFDQGRAALVSPDLMVNAAILTTEGLADGVEIVAPGVYSDELLKRYHNELLNVARNLYLSYIKPFDLSVQIDLKTMQG